MGAKPARAALRNRFSRARNFRITSSRGCSVTRPDWSGSVDCELHKEQTGIIDSPDQAAMPVYSRSLIHIVWLCGILCFLTHASPVAASSIQGHISDPSGRVVANAVVILESDGQKLRESVTD